MSDPKKPYSSRKCAEHGEVSAICCRCHELALGQQRWQRKLEQEKEHEKYLARMEKAA